MPTKTCPVKARADGHRAPALDEPLKKAGRRPHREGDGRALGLHTVGDLLHHYPRRYAERGELTELAELPLDEHVTVSPRSPTVRRAPMPTRRGQRAGGHRHRRQRPAPADLLQPAWRERGPAARPPRAVRRQGRASSTASASWPTPTTSCWRDDRQSTPTRPWRPSPAR